jgi:hypothetical protein
LYRDPRASVVRVLGDDGSTTGTAFFCLPKGLLATCAHVLDAKALSEKRVSLRFNRADTDVELQAAICSQWFSPAHEEDVAILRLLSELPQGAIPLVFGSSKPRLGALVGSFGYSANNPVFGMPGQAEFSGMTREVDTGVDVYVVRGDSIARGFSGAPCVLVETGEVLGVVTALTMADREGRWPNGVFVRPSDNVLRLCPDLITGIPPVVQTLLQPWNESWEPFQKYRVPLPITSTSKVYEFPTLEEISISRRSVAAIGLLQEEFDSEERKVIIIVGAPGTGKSRLLAEMARAVCYPSRNAQAVPELVPILFTARSFAESARAGTVAERIAESLRIDGVLSTVRAISANAIEELLLGGRYRCLIMIDGADEVTNPIDRINLFRKIVGDARTILSEGHIIVVSTRPLAEIDDNFVDSICRSYRLSTLDSKSSDRLIFNTLGSDSTEFRHTVTSSGLAPFLDTPLLFNLAMDLFRKRGSARFPATILGIYESFLSLIKEKWVDPDPPLGVEQTIEILGSVALGILDSQALGHGDKVDVWLTEVDRAVQEGFRRARESENWDIDTTLSTIQSVLNFGLRASGLMFRQGDVIHWSHLLIRDYLVALCLRAKVRTQELEVRRLINFQFNDQLWRESLILFIVIESNTGVAENLLKDIYDNDSGFSMEMTLFIKDCIQRGAVFGDAFLALLFIVFEEYALQEQDYFASGTCRGLFSDDYGAFWHLLRLQRIPHARHAILRAVSRAKTGSTMAEWPHSALAKALSPRSLYGGLLATEPAIFDGAD